MSWKTFWPMFVFEKDPMLVFHTGFQPALAGRSARAFGARSAIPHRFRASVIPIVCPAGNGGGDVSPERYRFSEFQRWSKTFSSRCLGKLFGRCFFFEKDPMSVFHTGRRPAGRSAKTPSKIFFRSALAGLAPMYTIRIPIPIVYAYGTSFGVPPAETLFLHTPPTYRIFKTACYINQKLFQDHRPKVFQTIS